MSTPQRILIVGCPGSGKSTLARQLAPLLDLPIIHLDREYWRAGWTEPTSADWDATVLRLVEQPRWIIDGNYGRSIPARLAVADAAIHLDLPRRICLPRVIRRSLQQLGRARPDMPPGCPERLPSFEFLFWIWHFPHHRRPALVEQLAAAQSRGCQVITLTSPPAIRTWLDRARNTPGTLPAAARP